MRNRYKYVRPKWVTMRIGNKSSLLRLLDSKMAIMMDVILEGAKEDGIWISSVDTREYIERKAGISTPTYFRYIKTLRAKSILLPRPSQGRGVYKLNPEMLKLVN